jgi:hypothetical protein
MKENKMTKIKNQKYAIEYISSLFKLEKEIVEKWIVEKELSTIQLVNLIGEIIYIKETRQNLKKEIENCEKLIFC